MNVARMRKHRMDESKRHQELHRGVKRGYRRDKKMYVESEAEGAEEAGRR